MGTVNRLRTILIARCLFHPCIFQMSAAFRQAAVVSLSNHQNTALPNTNGPQDTSTPRPASPAS